MDVKQPNVKLELMEASDAEEMFNAILESGGSLGSPGKPTLKDTYDKLARLIDQKLSFIRVDDDQAILLHEVNEKGVLRQVENLDIFRDKIAPIIESKLSPEFDIFCENSRVSDFMKYYKIKTKKKIHMSDIKPLLFLSEPGYTFCRLNFDLPAVPGETPTWEDLLNRMTNADKFCMWFGSLTNIRKNRSQYLFLHGKGKNGKSTILEVTEHYLGDSYKADDVDNMGGKNYTASLVNKLVIGFDDINATAMVMSSKLKQYTGSNLVTAERKYKDAVSAKLICKIIITSNKKVQITNETANVRRLILCEMSPMPEGKVDPEFKFKLITEFPSFFAKCKEIYEKNCPTGEIPYDIDADDAVAGAIAENEEKYHMHCERLFEFGPNYRISLRDLESIWAEWHTTMPGIRRLSELTEFIENKGLAVKKRILEEKNGVKTKLYYFVGMRKKIGEARTSF